MRRYFLGRFDDIIPHRVLVYRVWLIDLKNIVDLAATLKEFVRFIETFNSLDLLSLNVILMWLIIK